MKKDNLEASATARLQILFLLVIAGTIFCAFVLQAIYTSIAKLPVVDPLVLVPRHRGGLSPKPVERFVFLVLALVVPLVASGSMLATRHLSVRVNSPTARIAGAIPPLLCAAAFFFPFVGFNFGQSLLSGVSMPPEHPLRFLAACLIAAGLWIGSSSLLFRTRPSQRRAVSRLAIAIFLIALTIQIGAWRLVSDASLTVAATWWNSADAVIYSLSQVVVGKTLLVDMPSQYGLYAEIIGPIFKLIGLSIFKFSALWAVLQVVSLGAVFYVVRHRVRDSALLLAFSVAIVMITFETCLWFIGVNERYWQYWPIRFFWPAMSVFAFHRYTIRPTLGRFMVVSAIGAIGSIWNADSGLMIEITIGAFLVFRYTASLFSNRREGNAERRSLLVRLGVHLAVFVAAVACMALYLIVKSGHELNWRWLFEYQRLFYGIGFMMLPMPMRPSPWMPILAIYVFGMMVAVGDWLNRPKSRSADLTFYLSLLGVGLFVYYEGRSHILNLITVCWPAVALATLLSDRVVRAVRVGLLPRVQLCLPVVTLALLLFCCIPFVENVPMLFEDSLSSFNSMGIPDDPLVADELAFIREHSKPGQQCLILARRQGMYYAEEGLSSPLTGPGYAELITSDDRGKLLRQLQSLAVHCVFVGAGKDSAIELDFDPVAQLKQYVVVAASPKQSMLLLRPR